MQQQDNHEYPFLYQRQTCHQVQPNQATYQKRQKCQPATYRSEERFSRNAETDLVCRLLLEKKKRLATTTALELGNNISRLHAVLIAGCPGTRAAVRHLPSRSGRDGL